MAAPVTRQKEALEMIQHKIVHILNGDPEFHVAGTA